MSDNVFLSIRVHFKKKMIIFFFFKVPRQKLSLILDLCIYYQIIELPYPHLNWLPCRHDDGQ